MKKEIFFILLISIGFTCFGQPSEGTGGPCANPPCGNGPPPWTPCPSNNPNCNTVPIDDYLPLLLVVSIAFGIYTINKKEKKLKEC